MAKPIGMIEIEWQGKRQYRPAFRIGTYWAVNAATENGELYNVSHIATGLRLVGYVKIMQAKRLVGVLDTLLPCDTYAQVESLWNRLPRSVQSVFLNR